MKKIISILLVVLMLLSFVGCGSKKVELTVDNYSTYLDIYAYCKPDGDIVFRDFNHAIDDTVYWNGSIRYGVQITGASTNYDYNDVVVTVKFNGTYDAPSNGSLKEFKMDKELTVSLNIGGEGEKEFTKSLGGSGTNSSHIKTNYEVISISGYVTEK